MTDYLSNALASGKRFKLFLVEEDDEDRERVIAARVDTAEIDVESEWADVHTEAFDFPVASFVTATRYTLTIKLAPFEDGTMLRIENFGEEDEQESD